MVAFPHCKINLGLRVLSKRSDGYHNIETCFYPVPWTDILEAIPSNQFEFTSSGLEIAGAVENNLCVKAYRLLQNDFNFGPVKIHLHKIVPMGAGLGGGSSDAAFALRILNSIFELKLSVERLQQYASIIGSDCAFFSQNAPMIGTGRGEILSEVKISLKDFYLVLIKPDVHVSTAEAYQGVRISQDSQGLESILKQPVTAWRELLKNDFEETVFQKYPTIKKIKQKLYDAGAQYASMSGSGAAVFGLFERPVDLRKEFEDCSYWSDQLSA